MNFSPAQSLCSNTLLCSEQNAKLVKYLLPNFKQILILYSRNRHCYCVCRLAPSGYGWKARHHRGEVGPPWRSLQVLSAAPTAAANLEPLGGGERRGCSGLCHPGMRRVVEPSGQASVLQEMVLKGEAALQAGERRCWAEVEGTWHVAAHGRVRGGEHVHLPVACRALGSRAEEQPCPGQQGVS